MIDNQIKKYKEFIDSGKFFQVGDWKFEIKKDTLLKTELICKEMIKRNFPELSIIPCPDECMSIYFRSNSDLILVDVYNSGEIVLGISFSNKKTKVLKCNNINILLDKIQGVIENEFSRLVKN